MQKNIRAKMFHIGVCICAPIRQNTFIFPFSIHLICYLVTFTLYKSRYFSLIVWFSLYIKHYFFFPTAQFLSWLKTISLLPVSTQNRIAIRQIRENQITIQLFLLQKSKECCLWNASNRIKIIRFYRVFYILFFANIHFQREYH